MGWDGQDDFGFLGEGLGRGNVLVGESGGDGGGGIC